MGNEDLLGLAERVETFNAKLRRIVGLDDAQLSPSGKATAIALLATLDQQTFVDVAAALRSRASLKVSER